MEAIAFTAPAYASGRAVTVLPSGALVAGGSFETSLSAADGLRLERSPAPLIESKGAAGFVVQLADRVANAEGSEARGEAVVALAARPAGGYVRAWALAQSTALIEAVEADQRIGWSHELRTTNYARVADIAVAGDGATAVAGSFAGTLRIGDQVLTSAGVADGFAALIEPGGKVAWAVRVGGPGADHVHGVDLDARHIALAGTFTLRAELRDQQLVGAGKRPHPDGFVAVLDRSGAVAWLRGFGDPGGDGAFGAVLADERLIAVGTFDGVTDPTGERLQASGGSDGFVAAWQASDGTPLWSLRLGGDAADEAVHLARFGSTVVVGGTFASHVELGAHSADSAGGQDVFLAGVAVEDGQILWAQAWGGAGQDSLGDVDSNGEVLAVTGTFSGTATIAGVALEGPPSALSAFVTALRLMTPGDVPRLSGR